MNPLTENERKWLETVISINDDEDNYATTVWTPYMQKALSQIDAQQKLIDRLREALILIKENIYVDVDPDGRVERIELNLTGDQNPFADIAAKQNFGNSSFPELKWFIDQALALKMEDME